MKGRAWWVLIAVVLVVGVLLIAARRAPEAPHIAAPRAPEPESAWLTLHIDREGVRPEHAEVPLGSRLVLTRVNESADERILSLAGYEHALAACTLRAGESRTDTLLLTLPGEDFAWLLDRRPVGRLSVQGSHLVEGHR